MGEVTIDDMFDTQTGKVFSKLSSIIDKPTILYSDWGELEVYVGIPEPDVNKFHEFLNSKYVGVYKSTFPGSAGIEPRGYLASDIGQDKMGYTLLYHKNEDPDDIVKESGISYESSEDGVQLLTISLRDWDMLENKATDPPMQLFVRLIEAYSEG